MKDDKDLGGVSPTAVDKEPCSVPTGQLSHAERVDKAKAELWAVIDDYVDFGDAMTFEVDKAIAELVEAVTRKTALRSQPAWQAIETAPKDGTDILTLWKKRQLVARWSRDYEAWVCAGDMPFVPTYWMPLPTPPVGCASVVTERSE